MNSIRHIIQANYTSFKLLYILQMWLPENFKLHLRFAFVACGIVLFKYIYIYIYIEREREREIIFIIFIFEKERVCASRGGAEREGTEDLKWVLCWQQ